jgi:hypothetical protein
MKFNKVDLGARLPFEEVTDVAPRDVTPPVTVWVRLLLSEPDAVAAMLVEWVCPTDAT